MATLNTSSCINCKAVRNWSLITGRGAYKMGKLWVRNFLRPPQDRVKTIAPPPPCGNFLRPPPPPPLNMAKVPSYHINTTPKLVVPPPPPTSAWLKLFPPPFPLGKTSRAPLPFCSPPPPPHLPVICDKSLISRHF